MVTRKNHSAKALLANSLPLLLFDKVHEAHCPLLPNEQNVILRNKQEKVQKCKKLLKERNTSCRLAWFGKEPGFLQRTRKGVYEKPKAGWGNDEAIFEASERNLHVGSCWICLQSREGFYGLTQCRVSLGFSSPKSWGSPRPSDFTGAYKKQ